LRSIRRGSYKYVHHVRDSGADELYRLASTSPYETTDLMASEPDTAEQMRQALFARYGIPAHEVTLPCVAR
jgi:hypothetical protein